MSGHTKWSEIKRKLDPKGLARVEDRKYVMAAAEDAYQRGFEDGLAAARAAITVSVTTSVRHIEYPLPSAEYVDSDGPA